MGDNRTHDNIRSDEDFKNQQEGGEVLNDKSSKLWRSAEEVQVKTPAVQVNGKIPDWLNGLYLRIGPGKFDLGDDFTMNSWLDGYAIASKFEIDGLQNSVHVQTKFLESAAYKGAMKHGKPIFPEYGTRKYSDPAKGFFSSLVSNFVPEMSDNPTTNYLHYDSSNSVLFVGGESCYFHEYDPESMRITERYDSKELFGFQVCSMHPLIDCNDPNTVYNIGTSILTGVKYNIFKITSETIATTHGQNQSNKTVNRKDLFKKSFKVLCTINSRWTTSMGGIHSFGQTKNYIIIVEQPYVANVKKTLANAIKGKVDCIANSMEWYPEASNRFYIVSKSTGEVINKSFEILSESPFFFVHLINTYEDYCKVTKKSFVVVDVLAFDDPSSLNAQNLQQLRSTKFGFKCSCTADTHYQADHQRFIIPLDLDVKKTPVGPNLLTLDNAQCNSNELSTINQSIATAILRKASSKSPQIILTSKLIMRKGLELPTMNKHFNGKPYKYYYASGLVTVGEFENAVAKVDVESCQVTVWRESPYFIFGEPVFVSRYQCQQQQTTTGFSSSSNSNNGEAIQEDDGVLIVPMTDSRKDFPDMLFFFNPKDMTEIARAIFDVRVPPSIHGTFIDRKR